MAKLVVRALRCVVETDEGGSDDPYMIVFRGSLNLPPDVKVVGGKGSAWADMTSGTLRISDVLVDDTYSSGNAYVVAMLEQDWAKDILTDGSWGSVVEFWAKWWSHFTTPAGRIVCATSALIVGGALDNDELLSVRNLEPIYQLDGTGQLVEFSGDGGHYRARFVKRL